MKWVILGIAALGCLFLGMGWLASRGERRGDDYAYAFPYLIGFVLLVLDGGLAIGYAIVKALVE